MLSSGRPVSQFHYGLSVKWGQVRARHREFRGDEVDTGNGATGGTPDDVPSPITGSLHRDVGLAVAVVIAGHRPVAAHAPRVIDGYVVRTPSNHPLTRARTEDSDICFAVAIVVGLHRPVTRDAELHIAHAVVTAVEDIPVGIGGAEYGYVLFTVAVIVARHDAVAGLAELHTDPTRVVVVTAAREDVPGGVGRAEDCDVGSVISVVVAGHGDVAAQAPRVIFGCAVRTPQNRPQAAVAAAGAVDGVVGLAVAVVVAGCGNVPALPPLGGGHLVVSAVEDVPVAVAAVEGRDIGLAVAVEICAVVSYGTGGDERLLGLNRWRQSREECDHQETKVELARGQPRVECLIHCNLSSLCGLRAQTILRLRKPGVSTKDKWVADRRRCDQLLAGRGSKR
jgi:hypothetical protein